MSKATLYLEEPLPPAAKKLKGDELFRIRIGNYRVIYEIRDHLLVVFVVKAGHRKDVSRGWRNYFPR